MSRKCELCPAVKTRLSAAEQNPKPIKLRRVLIEDRLLALCERHAEKVREKGFESLAELRKAFPERGGQRSMLERRATLDRRTFPARPEGRRASAGRRASDPAE